jgi:hypothetical protein
VIERDKERQRWTESEAERDKNIKMINRHIDRQKEIVYSYYYFSLLTIARAKETERGREKQRDR